MIDRILIGYDGSASAQRAFDFALDMSHRYNAELHVIAVAVPPDFGSDVETEASIEHTRRQCHKLLEPLKIRYGAGPVVFEILVGHPAEQLVRYAEQRHIDHIVVGHRGRTLFERWLIGSVARQVIAYAHCAVTVVRN